jgi:hypothetical protein
MRKERLYEGRMGGFTNPFDDLDDDVKISDNIEVDGDPSDPIYKQYQKTKLPIKGVKLWNTNTPNKVIFKNDRMYAGQYFEAGDTVEIAPIKVMTDEDMYSKSIRDFAFVIDKGKGLYALPLGYAVCYRNSKESGIPGNIDYEFDFDSRSIKLYAITRINMGAEWIVHASEEDCDNEIKPGQFQYDQGPEPIYRVSNIKIV